MTGSYVLTCIFCGGRTPLNVSVRRAAPRQVMGGEATVERVRELHEGVKAVIGECMEAVSAELTFFTLPNCFELFGFDLMVDEDWHLWLLEANAEPDFLQVLLSPADAAPCLSCRIHRRQHRCC